MFDKKNIEDEEEVSNKVFYFLTSFNGFHWITKWNNKFLALHNLFIGHLVHCVFL